MIEISPIIIYSIFFIDFFIAFFFLTIFIKTKFKDKNLERKNLEITFIIPAYNVEKILSKSVESIKKSRYPQEKIKIIIVNDCSTDNTLEIANKLSKKYENINVFTKKNEGLKVYPVNYGLRKASTELVAVLDADTLLKEDLLEKAVLLFSDDTTMAVTSRLKPLRTDRLIEKLQEVEYTFAGFYRKIMGHINSLSVAPAFTIFRREFFLKNGYFDTNNLTEDLEMGMRIQNKHYNIGYVADSYAITDVPNTFMKLLKQRLRWAYGTLYNYKKYKRMFFNYRYGDLGTFVLPAGFISIMMISLVFLLGFYTMFSWFLYHFKMILVGWLPSLNFDLNTFLVALTDLRIILFLFSIIIGLIGFFLMNYELNENIKLRNYLLYIIAYLWILALFYITMGVYLLIGKKPKW